MFSLAFLGFNIIKSGWKYAGQPVELGLKKKKNAVPRGATSFTKQLKIWSTILSFFETAVISVDPNRYYY